MSAAVDRLRTFGVADFTRVSYGAHGNVRLHTYHIPRAQPAHLWCEASDRRHPSSGARGVEDAAPYGGCETYADACRVTGAATLSFHRRRAGVEARPYFGLRGLTGNVGAPHTPCTNPSVTPLCGATALLSGEPRAWVEVCGVYASVYHDADTVVFLPLVRGGVLDAPRSRDCRGRLVASVRPDR